MRSALLVFAFGGACNEAPPLRVYNCKVAIEDTTPTSGSPGDAVALTGAPFTTSWDTAVYVGDTRAVVDDVNRDTCESCDACLDDYAGEERCLLGACGDCDACDVLCTSCVERTTFIVPDVAAGKTEVRLLNSHGESVPVPFVVLAKPVDTGQVQGDSGPGRE